MKKSYASFLVKKKNKIFNKIFSEHIQVYNIFFGDSDYLDRDGKKIKIMR